MTEILKPLRKKIDSLDKELVQLLIEREKIVHQVAKIKQENDIPVVIPERIEEVINQAANRAVAKGGDEYYIREIYRRIIELSCELETRLIDKDKA